MKTIHEDPSDAVEGNRGTSNEMFLVHAVSGIELASLLSHDKECRDRQLDFNLETVKTLTAKLEKDVLLPYAGRVMTNLIQILEKSSNSVEAAFLAVGNIATILEDDFAVGDHLMLACLRSLTFGLYD